MSDTANLPEPPPPDVAAVASASAASDSPPERPKRSHKKAEAQGGTGSGKPKSGRPPGRPPKPKRGERLGGMIAGIGVGVAAFNQADGMAIIGGAEELGAALGKWAEENAAVGRVLDNLLEASAGGMVMVAVAKIALPIAANHGLLPERVGGAALAAMGDVKVPDDLSGLSSDGNAEAA